MKKIMIGLAAGALLLAGCSSGSDSTETVESIEVLEEAAEVPNTTAAQPRTTAPPTVGETETDDPLLGMGDESLEEVLTRVGVAPGEQLTVQLWAPAACQMAPKLGINDGEASDLMVSDLAGQVTLTTDQAAEIWKVAKTLC